MNVSRKICFLSSLAAFSLGVVLMLGLGRVDGRVDQGEVVRFVAGNIDFGADLDSVLTRLKVDSEEVLQSNAIFLEGMSEGEKDATSFYAFSLSEGEGDVAWTRHYHFNYKKKLIRVDLSMSK